MDSTLYITRKEIELITNASKSQVFKVTSDRTIFPKPAGYIGARKKAVWFRRDVEYFLRDYRWKTKLDRNITPNRTRRKSTGRYYGTKVNNRTYEANRNKAP